MHRQYIFLFILRLSRKVYVLPSILRAPGNKQTAVFEVPGRKLPS